MEFIDWSSDTQKVIENDEKEFNSLLEVEDNAVSKADFNDDPFSSSQHSHRLDVSWGRYFARKSPPMGDLGGSHGIFSRPQFNPQHAAPRRSGLGLTLGDLVKPDELVHHTVSSIQEEKDPEEMDPNDDTERAGDKQDSTQTQTVEEAEQRDTERNIPKEVNNTDTNNNKDNEKESKQHGVDGQQQDQEITLREEVEHDEPEMVLINHDAISITKSLEQLNMEELTAQYISNRDSNSTLKSEKSTDSQRSNNKFIQIAKKIKHIQRFYQFTIASQSLENSDDEESVEQQIEAIVLQYIASIKQKAQLSAVTYQANTKRCTVLILFEQEQSDNNHDNEEWMKRFVSFPGISELMDKSSSPYFTQLSS